MIVQTFVDILTVVCRVCCVCVASSSFTVDIIFAIVVGVGAGGNAGGIADGISVGSSV